MIVRDGSESEMCIDFDLMRVEGRLLLEVTSYFSCRYTDVGSKDSSQLILLDGTLVSKSQVMFETGQSLRCV
jgi:hypothetical protein